MAEPKFEIGDLVRIKSHRSSRQPDLAPTMVVDNAESNDAGKTVYRCKWWSAGQYHEELFSGGTLVPREQKTPISK